MIYYSAASFLDFQKSPSSDFIWRGTKVDLSRLRRSRLRGQKRLARSPRGRLVANLLLPRQKKKTDLKGMLIDGLCFSMERRVIFPLRNVKCKDYVSCQVVETTHLRLICIRKMKSRSSSTRKKTRKSDY